MSYDIKVGLNNIAEALDRGKAITRLADAEQRKATALQEFNEKLDDLVALGLTYLDSRYAGTVDRFAEFRELIKNRK